MYEPPPADRPALPCPKCGHNVAESWASSLKSCPACGVELELEASAPCLVVGGMMALFLLMGLVFSMLVQAASLLRGGFLIPLLGGLAMLGCWIWLLIVFTRRWGRLKVKA